MKPLQEQFNQLFNNLSMMHDVLSQHRAKLISDGTDAQEMRSISSQINAAILILIASLDHSNLDEYWQEHRSTVTYLPSSDLYELLDNYKAAQYYVFTSMPKEPAPNQYVKDTKVFLDGLQEHEIVEPHVGDYIITYKSRNYSTGQSTQWISYVEAMIDKINDILLGD